MLRFHRHFARFLWTGLGAERFSFGFETYWESFGYRVPLGWENSELGAGNSRMHGFVDCVGRLEKQGRGSPRHPIVSGVFSGVNR